MHVKQKFPWVTCYILFIRKPTILHCRELIFKFVCEMSPISFSFVLFIQYYSSLRELMFHETSPLDILQNLEWTFDFDVSKFAKFA